LAEIIKSLGLFFITALAELLGSYLMYLWLRQGKPFWFGLLAVVSLVTFAPTPPTAVFMCFLHYYGYG
jgi:drug/metabolite transporter superfamily protein YnfA